MAKAARRGVQRLAALVAILSAAAALAVVSFHTIRPGDRAFRVSRLGKGASPLSPGAHFVLPLLQRVVHVPVDPIGAQGRVPLRSKEGAELEITYDVRGSIPDARLAPMLGDGGQPGGPEASLSQAASRTLAAWGEGLSGESLVLGEQRDEAELKVREAVESLGFERVAVVLGPVSGPPGLRAALATRALQDRVQDTGARVALIGLDGADWEIIDPLIARGLLPNLSRLKSQGAWGNMKSMNPMLSPLLWTSVATGRPPEQHGIIDFLMRDAATGKPVPVASRSRKVKALWNILTDAGRKSAFVAWWATWPAEEVNGYMVSDRVAYSTFSFVDKGENDGKGATWPPGYFQEIRPRLQEAAGIRDAELKEFADATPEEYRRLAGIVASARSYQAVALDLLSRGQPDLFSVYYQGIDEVCHRFAHYMPPKMAMVSREDYERYRGTVEAYYRYQDRLLGQVLAKLAPDTNVILLSDHGFRNGGGRPADEPPYIEGKPGLWHRQYGIVILSGPAIRPGRLDTSSLLDVAPTVLYLLGLPKGEDMPGRVLEEAIAERFLKRFQERTVPSYEALGTSRQAADLVADSRVEAEMIEKLRSLGYVGGAGTTPGGPEGANTGGASSSAAGQTTFVTANINEAALLLKAKEYDKAEAAVGVALRAAPDLVPALILKAQIAQAQKRYPIAIETCRRVLALDSTGEKQAYTQLARIYSESGHAADGLPVLRTLSSAHPEIGEIHAALGFLLLRSGDKSGAEQELLEALRLDPSLGEPLAELHTLYEGTDKVPSLEGIVRKGLALNDQSVVHHNWMGLIHQWHKDLPGAEREFRRAMEIDPDYAPTMANLGALYGRSGRLQEAVEILTRAVRKDENNLEAWMNLGAAQGRLNHPKEAIAALETARSKGARSTTLFNALALAYLQDRQTGKAVQYLKESLLIDPAQKDARELLAQVTRSS
jgi:predicted AlkP superfamily phosphohydrolase/phosphomutase/predicted Zn-dependent protease